LAPAIVETVALDACDFVAQPRMNGAAAMEASATKAGIPGFNVMFL
jgi:hypothetical protein